MFIHFLFFVVLTYLCVSKMLTPQFIYEPKTLSVGFLGVDFCLLQPSLPLVFIIILFLFLVTSQLKIIIIIFLL